MDDPSSEKREPLAALHTYEPLPSNKIFPKWERVSKLGWIVAFGHDPEHPAATLHEHNGKIEFEPVDLQNA